MSTIPSFMIYYKYLKDNEDSIIEKYFKDVVLSKIEKKKLEKKEFHERQIEKRRIKRKIHRSKRVRYDIPILEPSYYCVIIDCSYNEYMVEKELVGVANQVTRCYNLTKRYSEGKIKLKISSFTKDNYINKNLQKSCNSLRWLYKLPDGVTEDVIEREGLSLDQYCIFNMSEDHFIEESYKDHLFKRFITMNLDSEKTFNNIPLKECCSGFSYSLPDGIEKGSNVVYLTADSDDVLSSFDPDTVYIIGGLLDHNRYKNLSLKLANENNIRTAALPIDDYIKISGRKVLTINQVYEIVIHAILSNGDFEYAFNKAIPARKIIKKD
eukprot:TRINITY_DN14549_c0_g1_i1.p1 TRINITY_DN14549_c0_g1~~TRINITY_DN14549_c0_g1_i1.p1  ORF type:complete len:324 (-),score=54.66 TRINITY_DN14549_c0_g1_i1:78-1049(-)